MSRMVRPSSREAGARRRRRRWSGACQSALHAPAVQDRLPLGRRGGRCDCMRGHCAIIQGLSARRITLDARRPLVNATRVRTIFRLACWHSRSSRCRASSARSHRRCRRSICRIRTISARCTCRSSPAARAHSPGRRTRASSSTRWPGRCGGSGSTREWRCSSPTARATTTSPTGRPTGVRSSTCRHAARRSSSRLLDLQTGRSTELTHDGAVNVEPRFSPDGRRIVYVSSVYHRHFHVFVAQLTGGTLGEPQRLTGENKSPLPRYYYSAYDHEINPVWTRDGRGLVFVSNRGRIHGTGGIWTMAAVAGAEPTELHYEETNWRTAPDFSPDGQRLVYSSYLGRNTLQLWLLPASGGQPFPLTYGDWDATAARWSPDGHSIACVSNRERRSDAAGDHAPGRGHARARGERTQAFASGRDAAPHGARRARRTHRGARGRDRPRRQILRAGARVDAPRRVRP